jgi:hypothetical protein
MYTNRNRFPLSCVLRENDLHVTVYPDKFLIIKPNRCTNFSNLFLEWNSTCFGQFLCPSSRVFHCTHSNGICHTSLAVSKPLWHIPLLCVQWKSSDNGQRNCPKHVEFHSKNKFEKLVHLVGFIIRNVSRCKVTWTSNLFYTHIRQAHINRERNLIEISVCDTGWPYPSRKAHVYFHENVQKNWVLINSYQ